MKSFMTHAIADMEFAAAHPEEFQKLGRYSITCAMRTVAALNPGLTRKQFVEAICSLGHNKTTAAIQFAKARAFDVSEYGLVLAADGSLEE